MSRGTRSARDGNPATRNRTNDRRALSAPLRRSRAKSPRTSNTSSRSRSRSRPKVSSRSRSRSRTRTSSSSSSSSRSSTLSSGSHLSLSNGLDHTHVASNASSQFEDTFSALSHGLRRPTPFIRRSVGLKSRIVGALGNGLNYFKVFFQDGAKLGRRLGRRCKVQFNKFVLYRCVGGRLPNGVRRIRYEDETVGSTSRDEWSRNTKSGPGRCSQCGRSSMSSSEQHQQPGGILPAHLRFDLSMSGSEERSGSASPSRVNHYPSKAGSASSRGSNSGRCDDDERLTETITFQ